MVPSDRYIFFSFEEQDIDLPIINKVKNEEKNTEFLCYCISAVIVCQKSNLSLSLLFFSYDASCFVNVFIHCY